MKLIEGGIFRNPGYHVVKVPVGGFQFLQLTFEGFSVSRFIHVECPMVIAGTKSN